MTPIRANIVGPPSVATSITLSIAACHSGNPDSFFGRLVMSSTASRNGHELSPADSNGSVAGTIPLVGNWTHRHRLFKRSIEPDLNRHPEKIDRY
jgi:hypothetical protein